MAQQEWVRVKDKRTGHEYSVVNVNPDIHQELDKPGAKRNGKPLPYKPKRELKSASSGSSEDLKSLTVSELQDRAKKAKVEGFSTMNKDQLVSALEGGK